MRFSVQSAKAEWAKCGGTRHRLGREVAIKTSRAAFNERFEREARAVAALNHPNICTLYDVGPDHLVMEYIDGKPVRGRLPVDHALRIAIEISCALDAAHRKGIVHRDLKPGNILITKSGVKLLDFGLAKMTSAKPVETEATVTQAISREGALTGTLQYMSPEQLQGREADPRRQYFHSAAYCTSCSRVIARSTARTPPA